MNGRRLRHPFLVAALAMTGGCSQTLDAGHDEQHGLLPVDQRNPIVVVNDGAYDNWFGEYAVLLDSAGGSRLAGIIVNQDADWPDIQTNVAGYRKLIAAAKDSGFRKDLPDPIASIGPPLVMPPSGNVDHAQPNRSEGALLIISQSQTMGLPYRPLVIATGGGLTDVADAYLVDPTVAERVVVVASLGSTTSTGAAMGLPNGDRDPVADAIVTAHFRYVQVSAWYDQTADVTSATVAQLPNNPLGAWIAAKQPGLWGWSPASDQVAILAAGLPAFVTAVARVAPGGSGADGGASAGPNLATNQSGPGWLVTGCDVNGPKALFWKALQATH
jgi:hypothetical protein